MQIFQTVVQPILEASRRVSHVVLVAGEVNSAFTDGALCDRLADWVADRVADEGLDDATTDETDVETGVDRLTGSSGADWFIINLDDKITNFKKQNKDGDLVSYV